MRIHHLNKRDSKTLNTTKKGWLYISLWKLLFVFLYHWHFCGLWTTFLQIIMSKFNVMNFHHLFYQTSYFSSYDWTSILKLYLSPSFWCMKHYPNFNFFCVIHSYSTARVTKIIRSTSDAFHLIIRSKAALCYNQKLYFDSIKMATSNVLPPLIHFSCCKQTILIGSIVSWSKWYNAIVLL
jgi:hypothetical protein